MTYNNKRLDWDNSRKVRHTDVWILNKIGNICGTIGGVIMRPYYKWGTFYTVDWVDDTPKSQWENQPLFSDEFNIDEVW
jgi:hypothetical protein